MVKNVPLYVLVLLSVFLLPVFVYADTATIKNTVKITSSTGGNSATNGISQEGKSYSSVSIKTVHNGEVVTDIQEISENGEPLIIEERYSSDGDVLHVSANALSERIEETPEEVNDFSLALEEKVIEAIEETLEDLEHLKQTSELNTRENLSSNRLSPVEEGPEESTLHERKSAVSVSTLLSRLMSYVRILIRI